MNASQKKNQNVINLSTIFFLPKRDLKAIPAYLLATKGDEKYENLSVLLLSEECVHVRGQLC